MGFTGAAAAYPMNDAGIAFRRHINGIPEGHEMPWTWDYAPNPEMLRINERNGAKLLKEKNT